MYVLIVLSLLLILSLIIYLNIRKQYKAVENSSIEIGEIYEPAANKEKILFPLRDKYIKLKNSYSGKLNDLKNNEKILSEYNLGVGTMDMMVYQPSSSTRNVSVLKEQLEKVKLSLRTLVRNKNACVCTFGNDVAVNGKKSEAKKLFNREIKLRIRCIDNEFKAATALADWNNINRLIKRATNTFYEINATGNIVKTHLQEDYLKLKIQELKLNYEIKKLIDELKEEEREERLIEREAEREEKRIKAALEKSEKERIIMEELVAEELDKLESASEEQKKLLALHQEELKILKEREKRAKSLAQSTRAGFVYVISNELSFGKGICKVGMTRRADPNERVRELGDASVPELFDVHTFVFTEDAPKLEKYLHKKLLNNRVNLVNKRKEFFEVEPLLVLDALNDYEGEFEITENNI